MKAPAIHFAGGLRVHRGKKVSIHGTGYPACCSGRRAKAIASAGRQTYEPKDVTCRRCQALVLLAVEQQVAAKAAVKRLLGYVQQLKRDFPGVVK